MSQRTQILFAILILSVGLLMGEEARPTGDPIPLSTPDEFFIAPQWSPDGSQVAASGQSYAGLYVLEFPTGNFTQLSNANSVGYGFSWSHDGQHIAARITRFENMFKTQTLVSFNTIDESITTISDARSRIGGVPRWSSDDAHIYLSKTDSFESFSIDQNDNSSLSESLIYQKSDQLVSRNALRSSDSPLFSTVDRITSYAVSPDGLKIAYSTSGQKLWLVNSDGSDKRALGSGIEPSWSPESEWIVYMLTADDGHDMLGSELYILKVDGNTPINISETPDLLEMHPQWSPDGSWIVFDTSGDGQLFVQQMEWR